MEVRGARSRADSYDREISNIFAIRDDITRSIVGTIGGLAANWLKPRSHAWPGKTRIASLPTITL